MLSSGREEIRDTDFKAGIQVYEYPVVPEPGPACAPPWDATGEMDGQGDNDCTEDTPAEEPAAAEVESEQESVPAIDFAEEARRNFEAGRIEGLDEGRRTERDALAAAHAAAMTRMSDGVARLMESFETERNRYLQAVEREAVKLAMAVAARILRRESQMDPLMLLGAVRVALGQLSDSTEVRLRVPPPDVKLWSEAVALLPDRILKPQIVAGEGMRLGDCVMETELGTVDLGVRAQLSEIECGFFDRAPAATRAERAVPAEPAA